MSCYRRSQSPEDVVRWTSQYRSLYDSLGENRSGVRQLTLLVVVHEKAFDALLGRGRTPDMIAASSWVEGRCDTWPTADAVVPHWPLSLRAFRGDSLATNPLANTFSFFTQQTSLASFIIVSYILTCMLMTHRCMASVAHFRRMTSVHGLCGGCS